MGEYVKWVMGFKECSYEEDRVMYGRAELSYCTPETITLLNNWN